MITEEKIWNLIKLKLIEKPFLEKLAKDMEEFEKQLQDEDDIDMNYWYQYLVKSLLGSVIISDRAQAIIKQMQPSVDENYIETLSNDVAINILFEQWDQFCDECLDPVIKKTAKRLYDGRNISNTGLIATKQEFKAYFNIKGDDKWVQFESAHGKSYYYRRIRDRYVEITYSNGNEDVGEQIRFPFKPKEYEKYENKIKRKIKAAQKSPS